MRSADFVASIEAAVRGRMLTAVYRVVVRVGSDEYLLPDTAILVVGDRMVQVLVELHERRIRMMSGADDIQIEGDYEDRTAVEIRPWDVSRSRFSSGECSVRGKRSPAQTKTLLLGSSF